MRRFVSSTSSAACQVADSVELIAEVGHRAFEDLEESLELGGGRGIRLARRRQVQAGQRLGVVLGAQAEGGVPHAQRGEDALLEELVQRLAGHDLDEPAEDVGLGDRDVVEEQFEANSFGRVAAQTAKQVVLQKLREAEREVVLEEFADKIGTVITGTVQRVEPRVVRIELGKATGILPASEQIPGEYYSIGSRIKVFLKDVERENRGPQLILSRANEAFVEYLFRQEVPEMETGAVEIKAIAREAGKRTKLAVASTVPGVDPVGTFVGGHGTRVTAVMNEIGDQEKIDIITFDEDTKNFIANALSPAEISSIELDEADKRAKVFVAEDQQSIAIGRGGQNVRLASKLSGYELDIETAVIKPVAAPKPKKNIEDSLLSAVEEVSED